MSGPGLADLVQTWVDHYAQMAVNMTDEHLRESLKINIDLREKARQDRAANISGNKLDAIQAQEARLDGKCAALRAEIKSRGI